jgi:hypothetical protein
MMARVKAERPLHRALESFATRDRFIEAGAKLREPVGPAAYWILDDADDADEAEAKQALFEHRVQAARNRDAEARARTVRQADPARRVRAIKSFTTALGYEVREGDVYDPDATDVLEAPEAFQEIEE